MSAELIDEVYRFYSAPVLGNSNNTTLPEAADLPAHSAVPSTQVKLDRIAMLAAKFPACVVLADVDPVDSDPIVRALAQDYVGDVLFRIMHRGHPRTRLVVSVPDQPSRLERDAARIGWSSRIIKLDDKITISRERLRGRQITGWMPFSDGDRVRPVTFTLFVVAKQLVDRRCHSRSLTRMHRRHLRAALSEDSPEQIAQQIWERLLLPSERATLGLIALSHDGLRRSTLERLLTAFKQLTPEISTETDVIDLEAELHRLVRESQTTADLPLLGRGSNPRETTYFVDDGWRRLLVQAWYAHSPNHARLAQWLIAREAATQSRAHRTLATEASASSGFSRDAQALCALVSSVDFTAIRAWNLIDALDHPHLEAIVLPPLEDQQAVPPDPTLAIRYAYLQLYRCDIEGDAFQHQPEDATLRLSMLLPFFEPQAPWLQIENVQLRRNINHYPHLVRAFTPVELVYLLTGISMAAIRIRRLDLVCAAARLVEQSAELSGDSVSCGDLLLPLRAEIDAAMLCGGNPDDFHSERAPARVARNPAKSPMKAGIQCSAVSDRIITLLQTTFAPPSGTLATPDLQLARAKLYARLGEAYHMEGRRGTALKAFQQALATERDLSRHAVNLGAVLGGRGGRSYLRLLLDRARFFACHWPYRRFRFKDGLALPIPALVPADDDLFREAHRIFDLNSRRLGRGRGADRIGARIDAARLHALQYDFDTALAQLDLAASSRFANGTSIEVLLELLALRARISVDATVVALIAMEDRGCVVDPAVVTRLAGYFKTEPTASEVAKALVRHTCEANDAFHRYAGAWGSHHPYFIFSRYLIAWDSIIASRLPASPEAQLKHLCHALDQIESARHQMYEGEYCKHFFELGAVVRTLRKRVTAAPRDPPPQGRT
jgi:hypothetical protein